MDIFGTDISLNNNEAKDFRIETVLGLPTLTSSDSGRIVFSSGQSMFYGYDGTSWLNLSNVSEPLPGNLAYTNINNNFSSNQKFNFDVEVKGGLNLTGGSVNYSVLSSGSDLWIKNSTGNTDLLKFSQNSIYSDVDTTFSKGVRVEGLYNQTTSSTFLFSQSDPSSHVIAVLDSGSNSDGGGLGIKTGDNNNDEHALYIINYLDNTVFKIKGATGDLNTAGSAVFAGSSTASSFIKEGGSSSQFLKADGSVDENVYLTTASVGNANDTSITFSAGLGLSGGGSITLNQGGAETITFNNTITNNNQLTNGAGYTTNTGTTTENNTQTFTNKSGNISQWTNDAGYLTSASTGNSNDPTITFVAGNGLSGGGTITLNQPANKTITLTNTITSNSQLINDEGYIQSYVNTTYSAGDAIDLTGTTFNVNLSRITTSISNSDGDYFVVVNNSGDQKKISKSSVNLSGFNNDSGWTSNTGTTTESNEQTFTNKSGNISQWTNDAGYIVAGSGDVYSAGEGLLLTSNVFSIDETIVTTIGDTVLEGNITSTGFIKPAGLSNQFLTADGGHDTNVARTNTVNNFSKQYHSTIQGLTSSSTVSWNLDENKNARINHDRNMTLRNPTNLKSGAKYVLYIQHDATSRDFLFSDLYKFPSGITPYLSSGGGKLDILTFESDGIYMYCTNTAIGFLGGGGPSDSTPPENPAAFTGALSGDNSVLLTWDEGSDNVALNLYSIERRSKPLSGSYGVWNILKTVDSAFNYTQDNQGLVNNTTYDYRMRSVDTSNNYADSYKYIDNPVTYYNI